ncbi:MAG: osmotically inducible protein OsmC [Balneola sp.]|nr:osmotically inducible protein OsmC [Balneola sp.]|tara:strand:- start:93573 stop:94025 length:453 start_codon:yes stop_codon:yes gene_type:complete
MAELIKHTYDVELNWDEGRQGTLQSYKLNDSIEVATPPEFPGGVDGIWSPEHLFVASVSSCFMTTFTAIAEYSKLDFEELTVPATGLMSNESGKFAMTEIVLQPKLIITDEDQKEKALRILQKAEQACLITRSIKTDVKLEPEVVVTALT